MTEKGNVHTSWRVSGQRYYLVIHQIEQRAVTADDCINSHITAMSMLKNQPKPPLLVVISSFSFSSIVIIVTSQVFTCYLKEQYKLLTQ